MKVPVRLGMALTALTLLTAGCFHSKISTAPAPAPAPATAPATAPTPAPAQTGDPVENIRAKIKAAGFQYVDHAEKPNLESVKNEDLVAAQKFQVRSGSGSIDLGVIVTKDALETGMVEGELEYQLEGVKEADSNFVGEIIDMGDNYFIVVTLSYNSTEVNASDVEKLKAALK